MRNKQIFKNVPINRIVLLVFLIALPQLIIHANDDVEDLANYNKLHEDSMRVISGDTRLAASFSLLPSLKRVATLYGFEANYSKRLKRVWFESFVSLVNSHFEGITRNVDGTSTNEQAESNFVRDPDETESIVAIGAGLSVKSTLVRDLLNLDRPFESTAAHLAFVTLSEGFRSETYQGLGLKVDHTIHLPAPGNLYWGVKGSYSLYPVKRAEKFDNEAIGDRTLLLSWFSLGVDISYFY